MHRSSLRSWHQLGHNNMPTCMLVAQVQCLMPLLCEMQRTYSNENEWKVQVHWCQRIPCHADGLRVSSEGVSLFCSVAFSLFAKPSSPLGEGPLACHLSLPEPVVLQRVLLHIPAWAHLDRFEGTGYKKLKIWLGWWMLTQHSMDFSWWKNMGFKDTRLLRVLIESCSKNMCNQGR